MPKTNKGGRDFLPGNPGGPGRKPLPAEIKEIRAEFKGRFETTARRMADMKLRELESTLNSPDTSAFEIVVASIFVKAIEGSHQHQQSLLDRLLGPLPRPKESDDAIDAQAPIIVFFGSRDRGEVIAPPQIAERVVSGVVGP